MIIINGLLHLVETFKITSENKPKTNWVVDGAKLRVFRKMHYLDNKVISACKAVWKYTCFRWATGIVDFTYQLPPHTYLQMPDKINNKT